MYYTSSVLRIMYFHFRGMRNNTGNSSAKKFESHNELIILRIEWLTLAPKVFVVPRSKVHLYIFICDLANA